MGTRPKDSAVTENFNQQKLNEDERENELQARRQALLNGTGGDDIDEAYRMLQDMRWVYRMVNGREKLKKLMESDDRQFVGMVRELLKIESAIMTTRIRAKEGLIEGQKTVFVILKGLEDEKKLGEVIDIDSDVDSKQIAGILNPDGSEYGGLQ